MIQMKIVNRQREVIWRVGVLPKKANFLWRNDISHYYPSNIFACMKFVFSCQVIEYENSLAETGYSLVFKSCVLRKIAFDFKSILGHLSLDVMSSSRLTIFTVRFLTVRI